MKEQSFKKRPKWQIRFHRDRLFFNWIPKICSRLYYGVGEPLWEDKWHTPRCKACPCLEISWLGLMLTFTRGNNDYWERWLWIHKYCNGDEEKAKNSWSWMEIDADESTWFNCVV